MCINIGKCRCVQRVMLQLSFVASTTDFLLNQRSSVAAPCYVCYSYKTNMLSAPLDYNFPKLRLYLKFSGCRVGIGFMNPYATWSLVETKSTLSFLEALSYEMIVNFYLTCSALKNWIRR
jgi:hypothetical protein